MAKDVLIHHLCHKVFISNQDGKKLLQLMKDWHLCTPVFPCDVKLLERHGGSKGWAAFRAGQLDFLLRMEAMANEYEQKVIADQQPKKDKS